MLDASGEVTGKVTGEVTGEVRRMVLVMEGEEKRSDIQMKLGLVSDDYFRVKFIIPGIESGYIEMKYPQSPNHPQQRYKLTAKGQTLKKALMS